MMVGVAMGEGVALGGIRKILAIVGTPERETGESRVVIGAFP